MRVDDATQERRRVGGRRPREAVDGRSPGERVGSLDRREEESWWLDTQREVGGWRGREASSRRQSCGWRPRRAVETGQEREANSREEVGVDPRRGSQHQTPEQRGEETR